MTRALALLFVAAGCSREGLIDFVVDEEQPYFESVLSPNDTYNTTGPYLIEAMVVAPRLVRRLTLRVTDEPVGGLFADVPMTLWDGDAREGVWRAELPGRPPGSAYFYYLVLVDELELDVTAPRNAPASLFGFRILSEL